MQETGDRWIETEGFGGSVAPVRLPIEETHTVNRIVRHGAATVTRVVAPFALSTAFSPGGDDL